MHIPKKKKKNEIKLESTINNVCNIIIYLDTFANYKLFTFRYYYTIINLRPKKTNNSNDITLKYTLFIGNKI